MSSASIVSCLCIWGFHDHVVGIDRAPYVASFPCVCRALGMCSLCSVSLEFSGAHAQHLLQELLVSAQGTERVAALQLAPVLPALVAHLVCAAQRRCSARRVAGGRRRIETLQADRAFG